MQLFIFLFFLMTVSAHADTRVNLRSKHENFPEVVLSVPVPQNRIVLIKKTVGIAKYVVFSQSVSGGDEGCVKFAENATLVNTSDTSAMCLSDTGAFLFSVDCTSPQQTVMLGSRVLVAGHGPICIRKQEPLD